MFGKNEKEVNGMMGADIVKGECLAGNHPMLPGPPAPQPPA